MQGFCPFHEDAGAPSFTVYEDHFFCYGCGAYGDIIEFKMRFNNLSFLQALEVLKNELGVVINIEHFERDKFLKQLCGQPQKLILQSLNEELIIDYCKYQHQSVFDNWTSETIHKFELGFCIDPFDELYSRITVPIRDEKNVLVGIAGRRISDDQKRKYKFIRGFDKGDFLYGLNLGLPEIQGKREMIIVEGYKDLWRCHESGIKNVVALMGNLATPRQVNLIQKYSSFNVIIALDNDQGGQIGTQRLIDKLGPFYKTRVVQYPPGIKDFGECKREQILQCYEIL